MNGAMNLIQLTEVVKALSERIDSLEKNLASHERALGNIGAYAVGDDAERVSCYEEPVSCCECDTCQMGTS